MTDPKFNTKTKKIRKNVNCLQKSLYFYGEIPKEKKLKQRVKMISGYYYKRLKTQNLPAETCPKCETQGRMILESGCRVHHGMFIPMWANKKCVFLSCEICKSNHAIPDHLSDQAMSLYKQTRYRWYHYIGACLLIAFFASVALLIFTGEKERNENLSSKIENICEGNVIYYKLNGKEKTSMYVDKTVNDTVFVRENKLSTNKNVSAIDIEHNYTDKQTFYLKSELFEMHKQDKIIKIYQSIIQINYDDL